MADVQHVVLIPFNRTPTHTHKKHIFVYINNCIKKIKCVEVWKIVIIIEINSSHDQFNKFVVKGQLIKICENVEVGFIWLFN